jgi:hypothetical protein
MEVGTGGEGPIGAQWPVNRSKGPQSHVHPEALGTGDWKLATDLWRSGRAPYGEVLVGVRPKSTFGTTLAASGAVKSG